MYSLLIKSKLMKLMYMSTVPESVVEVESYVLLHEEGRPVSLLHSAWTVNEITSTIYTNIHTYMYIQKHKHTIQNNINIPVYTYIHVDTSYLPRTFERVVH